MNATYLVHHGVQGQKWGVRKAEWYPIDEYWASRKDSDPKGYAQYRENKTRHMAKELNRLSEELGGHRKNREWFKARREKQLSKLNELEGKNGFLAKIRRASIKNDLRMINDNIEAYDLDEKMADDEIRTILDELQDDGFRVITEKVLKDVPSDFNEESFDAFIDSYTVIATEEEARREKMVEQVRDLAKDCVSFDDGQSYRKYVTDKKFRAAANRAADLGIAALSLSKNHPDQEMLEDPKGQREWFLFEDQTIGMPTVADLMANKNYSAKQVKQLINDLTEEIDIDYVESKDAKLAPILFDFYQGNYGSALTKFADDCETVKRGRRATLRN